DAKTPRKEGSGAGFQLNSTSPTGGQAFRPHARSPFLCVFASLRETRQITFRDARVPLHPFASAFGSSSLGDASADLRRSPRKTATHKLTRQVTLYGSILLPAPSLLPCASAHKRRVPGTGLDRRSRSPARVP